MSQQYQPWFERHPQRFQEEKDDMAKRGFVFNDEALRLHRYVEFTGYSQVDPTRPLTVRYPDAFPSFPPTVTSETPGRLLLRHQRAGSWEICVFGPNQARWSAAESGAKAIDEAEDVIRQFSPDGPPAPDDIPEPASGLFPYVAGASVLVPPPVAALDAGPGGRRIGTFGVRIRVLGRASSDHLPIRGVVTWVSVEGRRVEADKPFSQWHEVPAATVHGGTLIVSPVAPPFFSSDKELDTWLGPLVRRTPWMAIVFPEESGTAQGIRHAWVVLRLFPDGAFRFVRAFPYRAEERQARVPGLGALRSKRVLFLGAGSMGSKIAVSLAATGVNQFGLNDPDIYKPENAVRHEVGVEWFGYSKVEALANRLYSVNPQVTIEVNGARVGALDQPEAEAKLLRMIQAADLVVETTGSHAVSRWLDDICHQTGVPAIYATVTNGAWGGEVVRVVPGETACWRCWYSQYERDQPPGAPAPEVGIFPPGCEQPSFTGTTYEVGMVANLAAWMAVETLLRGEPSHRRFEGDYIRWVARRPDGTPELAPSVLHVNRRDGCRVCGGS